jgi:hypothetical protein
VLPGNYDNNEHHYPHLAKRECNESSPWPAMRYQRGEIVFRGKLPTSLATAAGTRWNLDKREQNGIAVGIPTMVVSGIKCR